MSNPCSSKSDLSLGMAFAALLFLFALRPVDSFDTFWQLKTGEHIWQTKAFLFKDTFSLAAEAFRLEHCWLHDLILHGLYTFGGFILLGLILPAVITLCGALLVGSNLRRSGEPAIILPVLVLCLAASEASWLVRPQLWTFLFALLYLELLHRGREQGWRAWGWLAPIMLLWVNLHAGCVLGLVMIALFGAGEVVRRFQGKTTWRGVASLAGAGALSFAAAFINPYGYRIPLGQLLAHLNQHKVLTGAAPASMLGNMEWLPPTFAQVPLFYIVVGLWGLCILLRLRRIDPAEGIFFLAFLYMGFSQIRHTTLVSLLAGFYLPLAVQEALRRFPRIQNPLLLARVGRWGGVALLAVFLAYRAYAGSLGWGLKEENFPVAATDFVRDSKLPGQLYNAYDWGGYLLWRLYPDHRVFVDGRQDSPEHFNASNVVDNLWEGWEGTLDRYGINTIITRTCYFDTGGPIPLIDGLIRSPEWALVYQDEIALVFLRKTEEGRHLWERASIPPWKAYETMLAEAGRLYREDRSRLRAFLAMGKAHRMLDHSDQAEAAYRFYLSKEPGNVQAAYLLKLLQARK